MLLIVANVLCYCVLSFYRSTDAAPPSPRLPFANSVEQRFEMVGELKEIKELLKQQNEMLRNGTLRVVVVQQGSRP
jgi:hypothetical protein